MQAILFFKPKTLTISTYVTCTDTTSDWTMRVPMCNIHTFQLHVTSKLYINGSSPIYSHDVHASYTIF